MQSFNCVLSHYTKPSTPPRSSPLDCEGSYMDASGLPVGQLVAHVRKEFCNENSVSRPRRCKADSTVKVYSLRNKYFSNSKDCVSFWNFHFNNTIRNAVSIAHTESTADEIARFKLQLIVDHNKVQCHLSMNLPGSYVLD